MPCDGYALDLIFNQAVQKPSTKRLFFIFTRNTYNNKFMVSIPHICHNFISNEILKVLIR